MNICSISRISPSLTVYLRTLCDWSSGHFPCFKARRILNNVVGHGQVCSLKRHSNDWHKPCTVRTGRLMVTDIHYWMRAKQCSQLKRHFLEVDSHPSILVITALGSYDGFNKFVSFVFRMRLSPLSKMDRLHGSHFKLCYPWGFLAILIRESSSAVVGGLWSDVQSDKWSTFTEMFLENKTCCIWNCNEQW